MIPSDKNIYTENYERPGTANARQQLYGNRTNEILSRGRTAQESSAFQPYVKPYEGAERVRERTGFTDNSFNTYGSEVQSDNYQRKQYNLYESNTDYGVQPFTKQAEPAQVYDDRQERRRVSGEDLMPSIKTMSYADEEKKPKAKPAKRTSYRTVLDKKGKIMLALYISFVTVLLTAIIVSGVMVARAGNRVNTLDNVLASQQTELSKQYSEIAAKEMIENVNLEASKIEFEYNGEGATPIKVVELGAATEYVPITNWFDRICDWLSGLVGG